MISYQEQLRRCRERNRAKYRARIRLGQCGICGQPQAENSTRCPKHFKAQQKRQRRVTPKPKPSRYGFSPLDGINLNYVPLKKQAQL